MDKIASQMLDALGNSDTLKPILAAAGASGLLGGYMTAQTPQRPGESPGQRRWRILRNAVLTGAAGGGATAAFQGGQQAFQTALPPGDVDPVSAGVHSPGARGIMGALGVTAANKGMSGQQEGVAQALGRTLRDKTALPDSLKAMMPSGKGGPRLDPAMLNHSVQGPQIRRALNTYFMGDTGAGSDAASKLTQAELLAAGLPSHLGDAGMAGEKGDMLRSVLNRLGGVSRSRLKPTSILKTPLARNALGLTAALAPQVATGAGNLIGKAFGHHSNQ